MMKRIDKPWGFEEIIEQNGNYVLKKLKMNAGHRCSIQYHERKRETVYLLSGTLKIYIGDTVNNLDTIIMEPNDTFTIGPYKVHRMEAIKDSVYLEASTPELDDVVRLEDDYGRVKK